MNFSDSYIPIPESGCWLWTRAASSGYGVMRARGRSQKAHRISWEIHKGQIPEGLCVCHKCDVSFCVNPNHLFLGTREENNRDRDEKGRTPRGQELSFTKLTESAVRQIRASSEPHLVLANRFGVSRQTISQVQHRHWWNWL